MCNEDLNTLASSLVIDDMDRRQCVTEISLLAFPVFFFHERLVGGINHNQTVFWIIEFLNIYKATNGRDV